MFSLAGGRSFRVGTEYFEFLTKLLAASARANFSVAEAPQEFTLVLIASTIFLLDIVIQLFIVENGYL
jgi:hypothetical protein